MKVINLNAPDEYKYENDYRKIPSEYLNPRTPKGRGKVKWAPFIMIPEQHERPKQYICTKFTFNYEEIGLIKRKLSKITEIK